MTRPATTLLAWTLAACTSPPPGGDDTDSAEVDLSPLQLPATARTDAGHFATSPVCADCHANHPDATAMRDADGAPIGPFDLWQGTMMANSARDPLWRAAVSAEAAAIPTAAAEIEAKCLRCHAPMAHQGAALDGAPAPGLHTLKEESAHGDLARDGVSCTVCHQIEDVDLGAEASFSGGWVIDGERRIYGPHDAPFTNPMVNRSGFTPVVGDHVNDAALCATCHQQDVATLSPTGQPTSDWMHEQSVYAEWQTSRAAADGVSCQDCHLPTTDDAGAPISTRIARSPGGGDMTPISPRAPYGRHVLVGGNTLVPQILRDWPDLLSPQAPPAAFDATLATARAMLSERTATLVVRDAVRTAEGLAFTVDVAVLAGHRFPTGIPVRRAWLRVTVQDADGATRFVSGDWDAAGRLLDGAGAVHPAERAGGPLYPHAERIETASEVQVYEAVLASADGEVVWRLLSGAHFAKDNRLQPAGYDRARDPVGRTRAAGVGDDPDYATGGDRVTYAVPASGPAPHTVRAELVYQPLSHRWAEELFAVDTPETAAFAVLWRAAQRTPEAVADDQITVP